MGSSSVGSDIFALVALLTISLLVLLLLRYYLPLRSTPSYLLVPVFFALALPCSIIMLVPIDLASSSGTDTDGARGIWLPERVMVVAWRIAYWLTFLLTWLILPLLGEYADSGYRDPKDRLIYSLRSNGRYQLIALATAILGAIYIFIQTGFKADGFKVLVMALAYAWGLVLAVYLMGHGLVAIPRQLFRNASIAGSLKRLEARAPRVHDKMEESIEELARLEDQVTQLRERKSGLKVDMQEWVDELADTVHGLDTRRDLMVGRGAGSGVPNVVTDRYLADLARRVKRARHKRARFVDEWQYLVLHASKLQAVLDASASKRLEFDSKHKSGLLARFAPLTPYTRYLLYTQVIPAWDIFLGSILSIASVFLIWSECVHQHDTKLSLIGLTVIHHKDSSRGQIGIPGQVIAAAWLCYMCTAALYSMSEVKVWGNRALVKRQTYAESACWYSTQVAKLTVPLSFNFITMTPEPIHKETTFYNFLGRLIDLTPLGEGFSAYFPIIILIPVCATLFNLYGKIKNVVGFGVLEDESDENNTGFGTGGWREGRILIERENQTNNAQVGLSSSTRPYTDAAPSGVSTPPRGRAEARSTILPVSQRQLGGDNARHPQEPEDDSARYFFQDLSERVKNTFESTDRPAWLRDIGGSIKKPKWLNGDQGDSSNGRPLFGRLFGGGSSDGGVRL